MEMEDGIQEIIEQNKIKKNFVENKIFFCDSSSFFKEQGRQCIQSDFRLHHIKLDHLNYPLNYMWHFTWSSPGQSTLAQFLQPK